MFLSNVIYSDICKDNYVFHCCLISVLTGNENEKHLFCCWAPFNDSSRQLAKSSSGHRGEIKVNPLDQNPRNTWPELCFLLVLSKIHDLKIFLYYYTILKLPVFNIAKYSMEVFGITNNSCLSYPR